MINTLAIDLLSLIGSDVQLKRVAGTGGGEWHGPCPFCGGEDRFIVQPNHNSVGRYMCRQCETHGDAISYVMKREKLSFLEACNRLG